MYCPNDNAVLHPTAIPSHHGQKVVIDQCRDCGGLWFDAFELYRARRDVDEAIEDLDTDNLRSPSDIGHSTLHCPRDQAVLFRFEDPRFPEEILLMRCYVCQGFWLNRGEFTRYQQARQKLTDIRKSPAEDEKLESGVERLLASHRAGSGYDVVARAGAFLTAPVGPRSAPPLGASQEMMGKESNLNLVLNVLTAILRIFILR